MTLNQNLHLSMLPDDARNGLCNPRVLPLKAGQLLFRFASSQRADGLGLPRHLWPARPWWVTWENYKLIVAEVKKSYQLHGKDRLTLGYMGRVALAVQQSYSRVDILVKAKLACDINAFAGRGATQYNEEMPNGWRITLTGWPHIEQLYIPNINDRDGFTAIGNQALQVISCMQIESQQLY